MKTLTKLILLSTFVGASAFLGLTYSVQAAQTNENPLIIKLEEINPLIAQTSKLQKLAKITPQEAQKAAEAKIKGKSSSVKLENEEGNLIYAVVIGTKEVKVDAGNGQVLSVDNTNDEKDEGKTPVSSIQVK